jgi:hypothetical protein
LSRQAESNDTTTKKTVATRHLFPVAEKKVRQSPKLGSETAAPEAAPNCRFLVMGSQGDVSQLDFARSLRAVERA